MTNTEQVLRAIFVKLIVDDEEAMTDYYCTVYGLKVIDRIQGDSAGNGETFREVMLSPSGKMDGGSLTMFKYIDRPKPRDQQVILGFNTTDIEATIERIVANGGKLIGPLREMPEHGVKVQFSEDPEGALAENIEML